MPTDLTPSHLLNKLIETAHDLRKQGEKKSRPWTAACLGTLARLARQGDRVNPDRHADPLSKDEFHTELLWDLAIFTFAGQPAVPNAPPWLTGRAKLCLVAESEWGGADDALEDFLKLLHARCLMKVLVFGYVDGGVRTWASVVVPVEALLKNGDDDAEYLVFGVHDNGIEGRFQKYKNRVKTEEGAWSTNAAPPIY